MQKSIIARGILSVCLLGCAAAKPLHTEASSAAIRSAEELGAKDVPQAALHLQLAKEGLEAASVLNERGQTDEGGSMLLRAEADAELAVALSRAQAEKVAAQAATSRLRRLQTENPYNTEGAQ